MKGTPIEDLTIHSLHGDFYDLLRKYVEKHGGTWTDRRKGDQLQSVYLRFPPGTTYIDMQPDERYERRQVTFKDGAIMFWFYQRLTQFNSIRVPYVYL